VVLHWLAAVKLLRQGLTFTEVPGIRQTGDVGSTSFSLRSLVETARVFVYLLSEVHLRNRRKYAKRPVRIATGDVAGI